MVLGQGPHEWQGRKEVTPLISVTDAKGSDDYLRIGSVSPSEDRRSAIDLAIIRGNLSRPRMFLRWIDGKAQIADALTRLHGNGDLLRAVCQQAFTKLVEAPKIKTASRQEKREREGIPRVKSPLKLRGLEEKWYGDSHDQKGRWNCTANKMEQRFKQICHLIFISANALTRGILKQRRGRCSIHFNGDFINTELFVPNSPLCQSAQYLRSSCEVVLPIRLDRRRKRTSRYSCRQ